MGTKTASATGKIILSGEYAMLFGYTGIALPSRETITVRFTSKKHGGLTVIWGHDTLHPEWAMYAGQVAEHLGHEVKKKIRGELFIETNLPLGKGMGSSTALVIAIARVLLGSDCKDAAKHIEDIMNPGNSGMDFAVIWEGTPILYQKGQPIQTIRLPEDLLGRMELIDSGMPSEHTPALVAWVRSRKKELQEPLSTIGSCAERIVVGESLAVVLREHHKAQVALGVVPLHTQTLIREIEKKGGAAKVIGAGGRSGGGGMILSLHN